MNADHEPPAAAANPAPCEWCVAEMRRLIASGEEVRGISDLDEHFPDCPKLAANPAPDVRLRELALAAKDGWKSWYSAARDEYVAACSPDVILALLKRAEEVDIWKRGAFAAETREAALRASLDLVAAMHVIATSPTRWIADLIHSEISDVLATESAGEQVTDSAVRSRAEAVADHIVSRAASERLPSSEKREP